MKQKIGFFFAICFLLKTCLAAAEPFSIQAEPWKKANQLFHQDSRWVGSDAAYSISLGKNKTLWLFGDTFINPKGTANRKGAFFIHNSIGIEKGLNPSRARIHFYWRETDHSPAPFFLNSSLKNNWYWPGNGILIKKHLLLFLMKVSRNQKDPLGFKILGTKAILIQNPEDSPLKWKWQSVALPPNHQGLLWGTGGIFFKRKKLYVYCPKIAGSHAVYLLEWSAEDVLNRNLSHPLFWSRKPVFLNGETEFSVNYFPFLKKYIEIQSIGFGAAPIGFRLASKPYGPWQKLKIIYQFNPRNSKNLLYYAAKAHPELKGAPLIITYASNTLYFNQLIQNNSLYYPRFLRIRFSK